MLGAIVLALGISAAWGFDQAAANPRAATASTRDAQRVSLSSFEALDAGGQMLVRWETSLEAGVIGFNLYRQSGGEWLKVNEGLVPAEGDGVGGRYELLDAQAAAPGPHRYRLGATLLSGQSVELTAKRLPTAQKVDLQALSPRISQPRIALSATEAPQTSPRVGRAGLASLLPVDLPGGAARVKITTTAQGMHFLSAATLTTLLNQPVNTVKGWINDGLITLSNKGTPVNFVATNGYASAGVLDLGLFFYAEPHVNNYTSTNVYWIVGGANSFQRDDGLDPTPVTPGAYTATYTVESEEAVGLSIVQDPEDDYLFWKALTAGAGGGADTFTHSFTIQKLVRTAGTTATLRIRLYGGSLTSHKVEVSLNGTLLGTKEWSGLTPTVAEFTFDATLATLLKDSEANALVVKAVKPGTLDTRVWVDEYSLVYKRTYFAGSTTRNQEAGAESNPTVTVPNFTSVTTQPVIHAFDVTDVRNLRLIYNLRVQKPTGGTWEVSFVPSSPAMRFAMVLPLLKSSAAVIEAGSLQVVTPVNLSDPQTRASYLAIANTTLMAQAEALADYRSGEFRTNVVLVDDIFNEFSAGLVTPHAISAFLSTACSEWAVAPRYVVLVGEGTWDYRNLTGKSDSLVPPRMVYTPYGLAASDSLFANVLNDGVLRVAIGRIPVKTVADFTAVFNKIKAYEQQDITGSLKALLVADQPDAAGDFISRIRESEHHLSPTYTSQLVHPDYAPAPIDATALRAVIQAALNAGVNGADGVDIMNYVGHGAMDHLGSGGSYYMDVIGADTTSPSISPTLANSARLPIFVAMTCVAANFAQPGYASIAETVLRPVGVGASAAIAPTGLSQDDEATWISRRIMELLARNTTGRLGDVFVQSASLYNQSLRFTPIWIYNLLGDPALRILEP